MHPNPRQQQQQQQSLPRNYNTNNTPIIIHNNSPTSTLYLYQVWKGNNKFAFGGRLILGPDSGSLFLTLSLILVPVIFFWVFVCQDLIDSLPHKLARFVVVISVLLTVFVVVLLLLTCATDPGIVPRNSHPPELDDEGDTSSMSTDWAGSQSGAPNIPPTRNVRVNGLIVKVKYCQTCMLYRPPRCSHCSICNNCVERFDHHCPWVGQCIGKRNYQYFFMFVSTTTLLCLYVFAFCWVNIKKIMDAHDYHFWKAFSKSPFSGILILYTFFISWFVGGLTTFHLYLIFTNQTTYENFRYQYNKKTNPYNLGYGRNFKEIFCSKIPSSKNNFRAKIRVDPSSVLNATSYFGQQTTSPEIGKRQNVARANESDNITTNQIGSLNELQRCGTQPRHKSWDQKNNWDVNITTPPDLHILPAHYFGAEHCMKDRNDGKSNDCADNV